MYAIAVSVGSEAIRLYTGSTVIGTVEYFLLGQEEFWLARNEKQNDFFESKEKACEELASWEGLKMLNGGYLRPSIRRRIGYDIIFPEKKAPVGGWVRTIEEGIKKLSDEEQ